MGTPFMPWQQQVADVALELAPDGGWAYRSICATTPRQSGKTTLLGPLFVHRGLTRPGVRMWLTAQRRQAARDTWLQIVQRVRASALGPRVDVRESNGSESLTLPGGATFSVFAPAEDALHGTSNEAVAVDEAWSASAHQGQVLTQAILPTFTTTGGQLYLVSTAGTAASTWFRGFVDDGRAAVDAGRTEGLAFFEWSLPDAVVAEVREGLGRDASPALRARALDLVEAAHPAAGLTLRRDALEQAAQTMAPDEFLRAYGNCWTETATATIPAHLWARCRASEWPEPSRGQLALSFDVALDRTDAAIGAAWRGPDGLLRVDVIEHRAGAKWLADRLWELAQTREPLAIAHDPAGPAAEVADQLRRRGLEIMPMTARDYATACGGFLAGVEDVRLAHPGVPSLDRAVSVVATKPRGDGFVWSRPGSSGSISPLAAVTQAAWAFDHRPEPKPAPMLYLPTPL